MIRQNTIKLAFCILISVGQSAEAQSAADEAALVQAMTQLGKVWTLLSNSQQVIIFTCPNNTFTGVRLASGADVSVDLQKTTSLMNPYLGIVRIYGKFQRNSSQQDGSCSGTQAEAMQSGNWHDPGQNYSYEIYYQVKGDQLWLMDGNQVFKNGFMSEPGPPITLDARTGVWAFAWRMPLH